jgi:hypothetical protein
MHEVLYLQKNFHHQRQSGGLIDSSHANCAAALFEEKKRLDRGFLSESS